MQAPAIYIHIPFCEVKCGYCDFYSVPRGWKEFDLQEQYVEALCREIDHRCSTLNLPRVASHSIFFGGGTPSLLRPDLLETIFFKLSDYYSWDKSCEITLETNPKTVNRDKLASFRALGVNRLSIGVQSFQDRFLKTLGRIHSGDEARQTVRDAHAAGFSNVSLDLIFAQPGQTLEDWQHDLETALQLETTHMSCYALTIEEGTPFEKIYGSMRSARTPLPGENTSLSMFQWTRERLTKAGLPPYEISNFARPGCESVHNRNYWNYGEYLGFGVSAASFMRTEDQSLVAGRSENPMDRRAKTSRSHRVLRKKARRMLAKRSTNVRDLQQYLAGNAELTIDEIDDTTAQSEFVMLALRTRDGVSEARFEEIFGTPFRDVFGDVLEKLVSGTPERPSAGTPLLAHHEGYWRLTEYGLNIADTIITEFFDVSF